MIRGNQSTNELGGTDYDTIDIIIICMVVLTAIMVAHTIEDWKRYAKKQTVLPNLAVGNSTAVSVNPYPYEQKLSPIRRPKSSEAFEV